MPTKLLDLINDSESRYYEREDERQNFAAAQKNKDYTAYDSEDRIQKRLSRLGAAPAAPPTAADRGLLESAEIEIAASRAPALDEEPPGAKTVGMIQPLASPMSADLVLERVLGSNDLININYLRLGLDLSNAVGRVLIRSRNKLLLGYGTGFMVSPRLFMTNNHVLSTPKEAANSQVEFNHLLGLDGSQFPTSAFEFAPQNFFLTNKKLDFTLVAINPRPVSGKDLDEFGWIRLIAEEGKILKGEFMTIVQHPNGEPKQVAMRENQLIDVLPNLLIYQTDTAPGSSGSPVFNDQWEMVALHHSGVPEKNPQGQILTKDGTVWQEHMGEHRIDWKANEGIRISSIMRLINQTPLEGPQRALLETIHEEPPISPVFTPDSIHQEFIIPNPQPPVIPVSQPPRIETPGAQLNDDGSITWQIPLQVTVQIPGLGQAAPTPEEPAPVVVEPQPPADQDDPQLNDALDDLADAANREYYDAAQDTADRDKYYQEMRSNWTAKTRFNRLHALLKETHSSQPRYKPRVHLYPWIDLRPDLQLYSIYSGKPVDAAEVIREDFSISQSNAARMQEMMLRESSFSTENMALELTLLEASSAYNCEHVVPQSWFDYKEPMKGDLHHLFTCDWGCNSFRNKYAYFDFVDFAEKDRGGCGRRITEDNRFEPSKGKGTVARAVLYFLLRYPGEINDQQDEFDAERLQMLIAWHKEHRVDAYEQHRNQAIFAAQGNRNPLIDHPEWAEEIDFSLGFD